MVSADFPFSLNLLIVLIGLLINLQDKRAKRFQIKSTAVHLYVALMGLIRESPRDIARNQLESELKPFSAFSWFIEELRRKSLKHKHGQTQSLSCINVTETYRRKNHEERKSIQRRTNLSKAVNLHQWNRRTSKEKKMLLRTI